MLYFLGQILFCFFEFATGKKNILDTFPLLLLLTHKYKQPPILIDQSFDFSVITSSNNWSPNQKHLNNEDIPFDFLMFRALHLHSTSPSTSFISLLSTSTSHFTLISWKI